MSDLVVHARVVTVGEAIAWVTPTAAEPLSVGATMRFGVGGAEANVAMALAQLGIDTAWISAVGDDELGRLALAELGGAGVNVSGVSVDEVHTTGAYFKLFDAAGSSTPVYFRKGSAASHLTAEAATRICGAALTHTSGITLALSDTTAELVGTLLDGHPEAGSVSFDVNYRRALWADRDDAASVMSEAAQRADVVFVGRDEAEMLWGTRTAQDVRSLLPEVAVLVVKDAGIGATSFTKAGEIFVPSPIVDVVDPVGAGDAFAAGWLSGWLRRDDPEMCLARGHVLSRSVLTQRGDVATLTEDQVQAQAREHLIRVRLTTGRTRHARHHQTRPERADTAADGNGIRSPLRP
ncbi:sugar kinase [Microbacterium sp. A94]|uniref:sugar kinase n=1 Tax=Microbacterium sp. A94 TaxID=3450717 RepID=UPI003F41D31F